MSSHLSLVANKSNADPQPLAAVRRTVENNRVVPDGSTANVHCSLFKSDRTTILEHYLIHTGLLCDEVSTNTNWLRFLLTARTHTHSP